MRTSKHAEDFRPENGREILSPLQDYVFSLVFGDQRHIDILAAFLKAVLDLPEEEYESLTIVNPAFKRIFKTDKAGIVDVRVNTRSGRVIHVELQVKKTLSLPKRLVYYAAKLLTEQIKRGQDWDKLHQVISIVICNHKMLLEEPSYINSYELVNPRTKRSFTDLIRFIILELPKLPEREDGTLWPWLRLFTCTTRRHYEELAQSYPEVTMAVRLLKELSLVGRIRMLADDLEIRRRDIKAAADYELYEAREAGLQEGTRRKQVEIARAMKEQGFADGQIVSVTGLSPAETAGL
jgi:predicted transposase/invertase (TIGR01784 family)